MTLNEELVRYKSRFNWSHDEMDVNYLWYGNAHSFSLVCFTSVEGTSMERRISTLAIQIQNIA
jgi:hypothetical protein